MKYFSLFSGIGGFEYGIQRSSFKNERQSEGLEIRNSERQYKQQFNGGLKGCTCVGFSEINKYATKVYKKHFPKHKEYGNAKTIEWSNVEDFELLCAGFPCQSFSIAGRRNAFNDKRGTLFFEIARCAYEKQPRLLLLENVKGLLSSERGKTFGIILNTLDELGYDLQWQVLNSKNFGVPQNRERVFIVGHLRGTSRPEVFPIGESITKINSQKYEHNISGTISTKNQSGRANWDGSTTLIADSGIHRTKQVDRNNVPPLRSNTGASHNNLLQENNSLKIRRLTPTECERLQGFPDGWTEGISDTQRYKCLGNAATTNVVEAVMQAILKNKN